MIKVFGHKIPDTDSVISAIAYAWYYTHIKKQPAEAFILGDLNKETQYVLDRFNIETPKQLPKLTEDDKIVIVDTNNIKELPDDVASAELLEIIDHHKLSGGITTNNPVIITLRPMASTASLIYTVINPELHELPKDIAGLMLAALLSDTLEFRSPTTTDEDIIIGKALEEISGVNAHELSLEMFAAKSDIEDMKPKDLILMDSKVFEMNDKNIRVSVIETTDPQQALSKTELIQQGMRELTQEENLDDVLLFVIDILNQNATPIFASPAGKRLIEESFEVSFDENNLVLLPGVVSRKKQIIPKLQK